MQTISQKTLEDTMYYRNIPVFIYKIKYPFFTTTCSTSAAQSINEHYDSASKEKEVYCRTVLYPQAVKSARYIPSNQPPFNSYTFESNYQITYNTNCITSLYMEQYTYMGGAHGATQRNSDTWDFNTGNQLKLESFYPHNPAFSEDILKEIEQQIAGRLKTTPSSYFNNYSELLRETFRQENFYLSPMGIVIYFQEYDIAPYATGIPEFLLQFQNS